MIEDPDWRADHLLFHQRLSRTAIVGARESRYRCEVLPMLRGSVSVSRRPNVVVGLCAVVVRRLRGFERKVASVPYHHLLSG